MVVRLDAKRRLRVPAALALIKTGDHFEVSFDDNEDTITFRRLARGKSWFAVLKQCPVSPDDLPNRRLAPPKRRRL
jgi:hypothetical protein